MGRGCAETSVTGNTSSSASFDALSARSRLVLFDGKRVELGMLKAVAGEFVGPDIGKAIITLRRLQRVIDNRYEWLDQCGRRKIEPGDGVTTITSIFDEIALYSTVLGTEQQQKEFITLLRGLVARGRAAARRERSVRSSRSARRNGWSLRAP